MLCNRSSYTARLSTADSPQYLIPFVNSPALRTTNKGREQSIAQASLSRFARSELVRPDGPGCLNLHQSKSSRLLDRHGSSVFAQETKATNVRVHLSRSENLGISLFHQKNNISVDASAVGSTPPHDSCRRFEAGKLDSCRLFHGCPFLPVF